MSFFDHAASAYFHKLSKDREKGHPSIPSNIDEWPREWRTTYFKDYSRLPSIPLHTSKLEADLLETIKNRRSTRIRSDKNLGSVDLGTLLKYSCGETTGLDDKRARRAQASAGARFPIEIYPLVINGTIEIPSGLYHYNVQDHALSVLLEHTFESSSIEKLFPLWVSDVSSVLIMTGVFWRTQNKYGERGYRHVLLEAGHIAQNMYLVATALNLTCCALGGTNDEQIEKLLDIDGKTESVVYAVAIGK